MNPFFIFITIISIAMVGGAIYDMVQANKEKKDNENR